MVSVWLRRTAVVLLASLMGTLVSASPAWAEDVGDEYHGGATDVGIRATVGATATSWSTLVGEEDGSVGFEAIRRWYDVWLPTTTTQIGVVWQCLGPSSSSSFLEFGSERNGLGWSSIVDDGPGSAGIFSIGCASDEEIEWIGVIRRSWTFGSAPDFYAVILSTGSRGTCTLPSAGNVSQRFCMDASGSSNSAWLASVNSAAEDYMTIGVNLEDCDYDSNGATVGGNRVAPAFFTVDEKDPSLLSGAPLYRQTAFGTVIFDSEPAHYPAQGLFDAGFGGSLYQSPRWLGWGGLWQTSGTFNVGLETMTTSLRGVVGNGGTAANESRSRGITNNGGSYGWNVLASGLAGPHVVRVYCLRNIGDASGVVSVATFGTVPSVSCAELSSTNRGDSGGSYFPTWWAPHECWEFVGSVAYFAGDTGSGEVQPDDSSGEVETCDGLDFGCIIDQIATGIDDFIQGLDDIPAQFFELLHRLFVPTTVTLDRAIALRDAAMDRPPWAMLSVALNAAEELVDGLSGDSCVQPEVDLSGLEPGLVAEVPSRCDGFASTVAFEAAYQIVRVALYGALLWALWGIAKNAIQT